MLIPVEHELIRLLFDTETKKYVAHVTLYAENGLTRKTLLEA